jgi:alpha-D-ribose 1-methylphosphonate 5-triphosphate synthase subunit PhnL
VQQYSCTINWCSVRAVVIVIKLLPYSVDVVIDVVFKIEVLRLRAKLRLHRVCYQIDFTDRLSSYDSSTSSGGSAERYTLRAPVIAVMYRGL